MNRIFNTQSRSFLDGDMDEMVETLIEENQARLLSKLENL